MEKINLTEQEEIAAMELLEMEPKQFEDYVDNGEHSAFDVLVLWKYAKLLLDKMDSEPVCKNCASWENNVDVDGNIGMLGLCGNCAFGMGQVSVAPDEICDNFRKKEKK